MDHTPRTTQAAPSRATAEDQHAAEARGLADQSPRGRSLQALTEVVRSGPAAVVQRERLSELFGERHRRGGARRPDLQARSAAAPGAAVQRKVIARVRTERAQGGGDRTVSEVRIEGRAPTGAGGGRQGDHTVAETLINESVIREVLGYPRKLGFNNILAVSRWMLPPAASQALMEQFGGHWERWNDIEGEDQNRILEELIQAYIERANKREASAFLRKMGMTTGGGNGADEKKAINSVREVANILRSGEQPGAADLNAVAEDTTHLVDMIYSDAHQGIFIEVVLRAMRTTLFSIIVVPPEQATEFVKIFVLSLVNKKRVPREHAEVVRDKLIEGMGFPK